MTIMDHTHNAHAHAHAHIPDYNDEPITIEAADICIAMKELLKQSEVFHAQFVAINSLTKYDKLCIEDNKISIQKLSPWRYFVRKYKNQSRSSLAVYLQKEIIEYEYFMHKVCRACNDHPENLELHKVAEKHYDLIQHAVTVLKFLRDKYNVRQNSKDISIALEMWCLKLTKIKPALLDIISNKRFYK
jgi:hypothetical protein